MALWLSYWIILDIYQGQLKQVLKVVQCHYHLITIMHTDARLTSNDTATINNWVRETKDSISAKN